MENDRIPPAGLHPRLVKRLLDNLENSDEFRKQFEASPEQALRSLGYTDPWDCMQLRGARLASSAEIKSKRAKLEDTLVSVQHYECALTAQEGF